jgi:hypothetical protein
MCLGSGLTLGYIMNFVLNTCLLLVTHFFHLFFHSAALWEKEIELSFLVSFGDSRAFEVKRCSDPEETVSECWHLYTK